MTRLMPHFPLLRPDARFWKCWVMGARTVTWTSPDLTSLARRSGGRGPGLAMEPGPTFAHLPCPRCLRQSLYRATPASLNRWDSHGEMSIMSVNTLRRLTDSGAITRGTLDVWGRRYRWRMRGWTGWPCTSSPPSSSCSISCTGPIIWLLSTCLTSVCSEHLIPVSELVMRIMWQNCTKLFVCLLKHGMKKIIICF